MSYTLDDLAAAQAAVEIAEQRASNTRHNNPNRGQAALRQAKLELSLIVTDLRQRNIIPTPELSEKQRLEQLLDRQFPNAESREEVEYEGKRYRRRFAPARMSNSRKTVVEWERWWEEVQ